MSRKLAIDPDFSQTGGSNKGPIGGPSDARDDKAELAARVFKQACGAFGNGKEVAFALGLDQSFVNRLSCAEKRIALADCLPLLHKKDSALAFINALCDIAGLAHAKAKRTVTKRDAERQLTLELRRLAPVFELLRRNAAQALETDEEGIDDALDEVTAERSFTGGGQR